MLKIKDNVQLEEIEKMLGDSSCYRKNKILKIHGHFRICENRHIIALNGAGNDRFDILYDLIKADLVEKVGE